MDPERAAMHMKLGRLRQEHDDLKLAIDAMICVRADPLAVQRMKKRKLELKDEVTKLASRVIPDMPA